MAWDVRGYFLPGVHFIRGGSDPQNCQVEQNKGGIEGCELHKQSHCLPVKRISTHQ